VSIAKNDLILNPDFYSADAYIEQEENQKPIYIRVFIQLLIIFMIFGALIFSYKYFMKNYYTEVYLWVMEDKVNLMVENKRSAIVIREEPEEIIEVKVENKKIVKISFIEEAKPEIIQHQVLTDEYLKLVEQSLVNY
jgi:hypothetical protein